ncbi:membrane protein [Bombiscardovia apis]|uniref:Membrane protein n=1 Tax=Bombiscardovia apis TaxID=2932182 RepID=A0ABN6SEM2_9BIFI|nr:membrane protein [Bombiscardovia apis]
MAAVITAQADMTYLPQTLSAVLAQQLLPAVIVIADCSGATSEPLSSRIHLEPIAGRPQTLRYVDVEIVRAHGASSFGDAVRKALGYAHLPQSVRALWLLHDDSKPLDKHCLEALAETWRDTPTASLLGAKQLDWEGCGLHNVGYYAARGRINSLVVDGEPDQEQYDARQDVFGVSLAGALLPLQTLRSMSDLGSWAGTFGQSADFSRRVCLSGGRVVVVPSARIGHCRARYEGLRDKSGQGERKREPRDSSMQVIDARETYLYAGHRAILWPLIWLLRLVGALWFAAVRLTAKQPYAAICELCSPWRVLARLGKLLAARRHLNQVSTTTLARLEPLQANRQQVKQWQLRVKAYEDQLNHPLLNNLARAHLRHQQRIRLYWALAMTALVCAGTTVASWDTLRGLFSGGSLHSDYLLGSAADLSNLLQTATVPWTWGVGVGAPAAPTPFFLVLLPVAIVAGGSVSAALAIVYFLSIALSGLSFWALAGIFTRSNPIRALSGLLWSALAFALPISSSGDLPNLVVMAFMPAAFAFTFRAVGMYYTEQPAQPHPSVRNAACAALCFTVVVLAEPQLLLALAVVFVLFTILVESHRVMLVLIPLPAALAISPTLINTVVHMNEGNWRQLFGDVTIPAVARFGQPRAASVSEITASLLDLHFSGSITSWLTSNSWQSLALLISLVIIGIIALVSLCLPSISRVSRLMWFLSIVGAALAMVSTCLAVGQDGSLPAAGSPLPGLLLAMLGLLSCVAMMAGGAVRPFETLNVRRQSAYHAYAALDNRTSAADVQAQARQALEQDPAVQEHSGNFAALNQRWTVQRVARTFLSCVLLLVLAATSAGGMSRSIADSSLRADTGGLPMVAVDYLNSSDRHRVLALSPVSEQQVGYSVMRTGRGDIVDVSAASQALRLGGRTDQAEHNLSTAAADLMARPSADAIESISKLGFGGIFVPTIQERAHVGTSPTDVLTSNLTASDGTQQVVSGTSGTYFRLTLVDADRQGVEVSGEQAASSLWWRSIWLWSVGLLVLAYCLVALPRWRFAEGGLA